MACRFETLASYSRKLALLGGLPLLTSGPASSAGALTDPQSKQPSVNDVTLAYQEQGGWRARGFRSWLLHGLPRLGWQRQAIASHYRFIALNLRYHGTTPWSDDGLNYSVKTHVDDVAAFIRGLNAGSVDLVGWSYSGPIVLLVALQHPELVHSLTIY